MKKLICLYRFELWRFDLDFFARGLSIVKDRHRYHCYCSIIATAQVTEAIAYFVY